MASFAELQKKKKEIELEIKEAWRKERKDALKQVKKLVKDFNITHGMLKDVLAPGKPRKNKK